MREPYNRLSSGVGSFELSHLKTFYEIINKEAVREYKNLLRNRLIGSYFRMFSTNSGAIHSQIYENLPSNSRFLDTARILGQPPRNIR